ncbi:hypothetical protein TcasGA2_TC034968, partial [Tribolium castaneum]
HLPTTLPAKIVPGVVEFRKDNLLESRAAPLNGAMDKGSPSSNNESCASMSHRTSTRAQKSTEWTAGFGCDLQSNHVIRFPTGCDKSDDRVGFEVRQVRSGHDLRFIA